MVENKIKQIDKDEFYFNPDVTNEHIYVKYTDGTLLVHDADQLKRIAEWKVKMAIRAGKLVAEDVNMRKKPAYKRKGFKVPPKVVAKPAPVAKKQ